MEKGNSPRNSAYVNLCPRSMLLALTVRDAFICSKDSNKAKLAILFHKTNVGNQLMSEIKGSYWPLQNIRESQLETC